MPAQTVIELKVLLEDIIPVAGFTVQTRENDGTEREAFSPGLGICQVH